MKKAVSLTQVEIGSELYFHISNVDGMRPFFMSIVSDANHWMFIGSNGGLSAGRKDADNALFPYYTDDKILESVEFTGSKSIFQVLLDGENYVWEPFSNRYEGRYSISRNLYKSVYGNKVLFEEVNHDLNLTFRYSWSSSNLYGFVRTSELVNGNDRGVEITLLDGIQNIVPCGVGSATQNQSSNLVDAYKRNELIRDSGIGIFALTAIIVDKAEPSEALKANIAWSLGLEDVTYLLSSLQLDNFRKALPIEQEEDVKAERGAYFVSSKLSLIPNGKKEWTIVANVNQTVSSIIQLSEELKRGNDLKGNLDKDIEEGTKRLIELNAAADGLQLTEDSLKNTRHFSNVLFNVMRGGIIDDSYLLKKQDLVTYLNNANKEMAEICEQHLAALPETITLSMLKEITDKVENNTFRRLCTEYLPLRFSRRHGDPSRPWNRFSINTQSELDGSKILDYEGNWRDIFQNWEALAHAYPEFIEGMIFRFLNASTFDGYNPYRITKNGIDWERIEPDDPWSYIGYWGDHQIIYLLKFLEFSENHYPGKLEGYFHEDLFVYANVPYKIKDHASILANPKDTIDFDLALDKEILGNWDELGGDAALLRDQKKEMVQVNFLEKILATVLSKMSNFIPEGGIWMNTQRPEWNDANNALVGNGVSMVTLCYLLRFLEFFDTLFKASSIEATPVSEELASFFGEVLGVLEAHRDILSGEISDQDRRHVVDGLGQAGSDYRQDIYNKSFSGGRAKILTDDLIRFTELSVEYLQHTIEANKRSDNLFHAYNIMSVEKSGGISISYLSEMLEGQVAALSSGYLSPEEALEVLDALKESDLFRSDQCSYLLYPAKELPGFMERNNLPEAAIARSSLLKKLIEDNNRQIVEGDSKGTYHFNGNFRNAKDLQQALDELEASQYGHFTDAHKEEVLQVFEQVFDHKAFTGRSGTFYGYEGLGSIYWHMVSKLLLAVKEYCLVAHETGEDKKTLDRLVAHFYEINEGIGVHKSPDLYGAYPTDPYSHTPAGKGAQQPGMTGQVKEDIISRWGELGITVQGGVLGFKPFMLRKDEFLTASQIFNYVDVKNNWHQLRVEEGELFFTYCQLPIIYKLADTGKLVLTLDSGEHLEFSSDQLDRKWSNKIFERSGEVAKLTVHIDQRTLS